jgi:hypothetical protein
MSCFGTNSKQRTATCTSLSRTSVVSIIFIRGTGWDWVCLVRRPLVCLLYQSQMIDAWGCGVVGWMRIGRRTRRSWRNPAYCKFIHKKFHTTWTWVEAVGSQRPNALDMIWPSHVSSFISLYMNDSGSKWYIRTFILGKFASIKFWNTMKSTTSFQFWNSIPNFKWISWYF